MSVKRRVRAVRLLLGWAQSAHPPSHPCLASVCLGEGAQAVSRLRVYSPVVRVCMRWCSEDADEGCLWGGLWPPTHFPLCYIAIIYRGLSRCCTLTLVGSSSVLACAGNVLLVWGTVQMHAAKPIPFHGVSTPAWSEQQRSCGARCHSRTSRSTRRRPGRRRRSRSPSRRSLRT